MDGAAPGPRLIRDDDGVRAHKLGMFERDHDLLVVKEAGHGRFIEFICARTTGDKG
jgi:hypothetical protein